MRPGLVSVSWWIIVVLLAVSAASAGKKPDQQKLPTNAGLLPSQKEIQVRFEKGSKHVPDKEARAALTSAIQAWNAVLPADLKLVEKPASEPLPKGEVVILVRFDSDPKTFPGSGVDQAGDIRGIMDRKNNVALVALFLVDTPAFVKAGGFSTTGAPNARDLEIVILHELGHALGIEHVDNATGIPPIMAPALDVNSQLLAGGKKLSAIRAITQDDKDWLKIAMLKRASRDVAGSYTGTFEVTSVGKGTGGIKEKDKLPVRPGDFVITYEGGKVVITYKNTKRDAAAVELLAENFELELADVADQGILRTMTIKGGDTPEEINVVGIIQPLKVKYGVKGTLKRK